MKFATGTALAALLFSVTTAYAGAANDAKTTTIPVTTGAAAAAKAAPDDVICTYEHVTGSHLPQRVCATRAVRDQRRQDDQAAMGNFQRGHSGSGAEPKGP